jgi:hypothetical protein
LIAKRAEIAGQIEHTQDKLRQLVIDLDHIDSAIHIFDPSIELEEIKNRPRCASGVPRPSHPDRGHRSAERQEAPDHTARHGRSPICC